MSEKVEMETKREKGQVSEQLGRVWSEIKQISKQVERETRKSGRVSRLRLEIHRLRREKKVAQSQLGQAVHAALQEHGDSIALSEVEELANSAATINILIENQSLDTVDEATNLKPVLKKQPFALVTSGVHMKRAMALFSHLGMHPIPAPTQIQHKTRHATTVINYLPRANALAAFDSAWHEYLGLIWSYLRHQI